MTCAKKVQQFTAIPGEHMYGPLLHKDIITILVQYRSVIVQYHYCDRYEEVSYRSQVQYGVPQGSVLGAVTFHALYVTLGKYH